MLLRLLSEKPPAAADMAVAARHDRGNAEAWRLFRLLAALRSLYRPESLGPFIISMTRGAADLLTVLLLGAGRAALRRPEIVPLFETLDDLDAAPRILAELFALDVYRAHLASAATSRWS